MRRYRNPLTPLQAAQSLRRDVRLLVEGLLLTPRLRDILVAAHSHGLVGHC